MNDEVLQFLDRALAKLATLQQRTRRSARPTNAIASDIDDAIDSIRAASKEYSSAGRTAPKAPSQRTAATSLVVLDHIPDGYLVTSNDGVILEINRAATQLLKSSRASLLGKPLAAFVAEQDRQTVQTALLKLGPKNPEQEWELELVRPRRGQESEPSFPARIRALCLAGPTKQIHWLIRDLSGVKRETRSKQRFEFLSYASQLLSAVPDFATRVERVTRLAVPAFADLCVLHVRDAAGQTLKIQVAHADPVQEKKLAEIEARHWLDSVPPSGNGDARAHPAILSESEKRKFYARVTDELLGEIAYAEEHLHVLRGLGRVSYISVPLKTHSRSFGVVTFATADPGRTFDAEDLTLAEAFARRAALAIENALRYEEAQAAIADRERSLALALQELKTPLSVILNLSQVMQAHLHHAPAAVTEESLWPRTDDRGDILGEHLEHITHASERMLNIVNDIIALTRMQNETLKLNPSWVNLTELVHSVTESMRLLQEDGRYPRDVKVLVSAPEASQLVVKADRERLAQVLAHLLDNALKYSPRRGTVQLELEYQELDESPHSPHAHFIVRDQGIGVPLDEQARIFQPFVRATNTEGRNISGIGVGLALCYEIITRHEGRIWVESDGVDCGSTFHIILPKIELEDE